MNKRIFFALLVVTSVVYLTSCYNNKKDISSLTQVSFVNEIVPILTSGACGCHNNGQTSGIVQFSNLYKQNHGTDTINYDVIYGKVGILKKWVDSNGTHPGLGDVEFTENEKLIIHNWLAEGAPDDQTSSVSGTVSYASNIAPIVSSVCSGSACHGGLGPTLSYTALSSTYNSNLQSFLSNNWSGHGGGQQSANVTSTLKAWIAQGMKP